MALFAIAVIVEVFARDRLDARDNVIERHVQRSRTAERCRGDAKSSDLAERRFDGSEVVVGLALLHQFSMAP
jgi:hypothetical protein